MLSRKFMGETRTNKHQVLLDASQLEIVIENKLQTSREKKKKLRITETGGGPGTYDDLTPLEGKALNVMGITIYKYLFSSSHILKFRWASERQYRVQKTGLLVTGTTMGPSNVNSKAAVNNITAHEKKTISCFRRFCNVAVDDSLSQDTDNIIVISDDPDCTIENEEGTTEASNNKEYENEPGLSTANASKTKCDTIPEIFNAFVEEKRKELQKKRF
ncbi:hypothetical protein FQA39_LY09521 [Lamprigera yunnana]|nr:hypothetical protein FQA39_LY09521 [Lamprigera yunnana]